MKEERWRLVRLGEGRRGIEWIEFGSGREMEEFERGGAGARKVAFEELAERAVERGKSKFKYSFLTRRTNEVTDRTEILLGGGKQSRSLRLHI